MIGARFVDHSFANLAFDGLSTPAYSLDSIGMVGKWEVTRSCVKDVRMTIALHHRSTGSTSFNSEWQSDNLAYGGDGWL